MFPEEMGNYNAALCPVNPDVVGGFPAEGRLGVRSRALRDRRFWTRRQVVEFAKPDPPKYHQQLQDARRCRGSAAMGMPPVPLAHSPDIFLFAAPRR
jgi:hypothetical protein